MIWISLLYFLSLAFLLYIKGSGRLAIYPPFKEITSILFLAVAFACTISSGNDFSIFLRFLPALLLCADGDLFMALHKKKQEQIYLVLGLIVFLFSHIAFIIALCGFEKLSLYELIFPVLLAVFCFFIGSEQIIATGKLRIGTTLYAFFLAFFCSKSVSLAIVIPCTNTLLLAVGAVLFLISDSLIFFRTFSKAKTSLLDILCLISYYFAMYAIALSFYYPLP